MKKLPRLKDILRDDKPKPQQSWEDHLAIAHRWHAVVTRNKERNG